MNAINFFQNFISLLRLIGSYLILNGVWLFCIIITGLSYSDTIPDPCAGSSALLNIVDRPTNIDSPCVVPNKKMVVESGYQYQQVTSSSAFQQNFPNAMVRMGFPKRTELYVLMPNYIHQLHAPIAGFTDSFVGIKHQIGYNKNWIVTAETALSLPDGSAAFGSRKLGAIANGVINYTINSKLSFSAMLGIATSTESSLSGGARFNSFNPDFVLSYTPIETLSVFWEIYGQTKTASNAGSNFNCDVGILYLVQSNIAVDASVGQRISNAFSGFAHYIGAGATIML